MKGIKGTGLVLGFTNGTNNYGLVGAGGQSAYLFGSTSAYGTTVSTSGSYTVVGGKLGITTDVSKSGIETEISSNINYIIKF